MEATYIASSFLHGLVVPIPKGHNKDLSLPNNWRGITILSNLSKVLEKLLLLKIHQQDSPPVLNPLQGGFREQVGCIHNAFILQEATQSLCEKGKKAYIAYLDVRKGFWYCMASTPACEASPKGDLVSNLADNWQMVHFLDQFRDLG